MNNLKKICEHCGKEFSALRSDAKYCSSSCRSTAWQTGKLQQDEINPLQLQLKGVITDQSNLSVETEPTPTKRIVKTEHPNLKTTVIKLELMNKGIEHSKLLKEIKDLQANLEYLSKPSKGIGKFIGTAAGAGIGYATTDVEKNKPNNKNKNTLIGACAGFALGTAYDYITADDREEQRVKNLHAAKEQLNVLNVKLTFISKKIKQLENDLLLTPDTIIIEEELIEYPDKAIEKPMEKQLEKVENMENKRLLNVSKHLATPTQTLINVNLNEKIISSTNLAERNYNMFSFQNEWKHIFGLPSTNFHLAIHGMPGEGKSTFALIFANYLADNFGKVIYISGEEGFGKTLKDKLINNKATSENLYIADLRKHQDIINEIKPDVFNFIFIDSLDNMRVGAMEMKEIRNRYANSALITISQSTKDGKMRGSQEIIHDADIAVAVSNGVAKTTKNRFLEKNRTFEIFRKETIVGLMPRNVVRG